ncbi:uncharacterized protein FTOL_10643 [Fusarium torulosum]|uniref:Uncharacterized protein n=1 Tax=Fusarium torulosum TaxID=33205 RepID=A0AAE8SM83_9HYPO|nr:uncharacterized protein FTOL_10643 [Fusarium torulosum]
MSHRLNQQSLAMQSLAPVGSPTRPPPLVLNCARQLTSFMDSQLQRQFASYASLFTCLLGVEYIHPCRLESRRDDMSTRAEPEGQGKLDTLLFLPKGSSPKDTRRCEIKIAYYVQRSRYC